MFNKIFIKLAIMLALVFCAVGCSSNDLLRISQPYGAIKMVTHDTARAVGQPLKAVINNNICENPKQMSYISGLQLILRAPSELMYGLYHIVLPPTYMPYSMVSGDRLMAAWCLYEEDYETAENTDGNEYIVEIIYKENQTEKKVEISFSNKGYAEKFWLDWQKYLPEYGGYCAYAYSHLLIRNSWSGFYKIYKPHGSNEANIYYFENLLNQEFWAYSPEHFIREARLNGYVKLNWQQRYLYRLDHESECKTLVDYQYK